MPYTGFTPIDCAGGKLRLNVSTADGSSGPFTSILQISTGVLRLRKILSDCSMTFSNGCKTFVPTGWDWLLEAHGPILVESLNSGVIAALFNSYGLSVSFDFPSPLLGETVGATTKEFAVAMDVTGTEILRYSLLMVPAGPVRVDANGFGSAAWFENAQVD